MLMFREVFRKLSDDKPLRVIFLNDTGFIGGAGIGHRRQIQSFLEAGHSVAAVCWLENPAPDPLPPLGKRSTGRWLGMYSMPNCNSVFGKSNADITDEVVQKISTLSPDLVIVGNLHWAGWPLDIFEKLRSENVPAISYLHDCYWLTGRCAYTGDCKKYLTRCDASCPTPTEYPPLDPSRIELAWESRRNVFVGNNAVPLFTNSKWMTDTATAAFHGQANIKLSPLGLDTTLFSPIDRSLARRLLRLPEEGLLVVAGAVDLREPRKGGPLLESVIDNIHRQTSARVVTFGARSEQFHDVISLGVIQDERIMPLIYSAVDVMIHTAHEESFGQTLMEASACGIPVVSMAAGGMVDIAQHERNAITVPLGDSAAYFYAVKRLLDSDALRARMGEQGRFLVCEKYSISAQYARWKRNLMELCDESLA